MKAIKIMISLPTADQIIEQTELQQFFAKIDPLLKPVQTTPKQTSIINQPELQQFFSDISYLVEITIESQKRIDKKLATGFNVFNSFYTDENKLSDVLRELLDPEGGHGQGDLFQRLLFEKLQLKPISNRIESVTVQREALTHQISNFRRRIDVMVEAGALLAIENKVDSPEQPGQVKDYLDHLSHYAARKNIPYALIYLTPDHRLPNSLSKEAVEMHKELHCWSYQNELHEWLEQCRQACEAEKIRYFLGDFLSYIESVLKRKPEVEMVTTSDEY